MMVKTQTGVYETHYHLVFVTKYRKPVFVSKEKRSEMQTIMSEIAKEQDFIIEQLEVCPDHIHVMLSFKPKYAASDIIKKLKGISARRWFVLHPETKTELWGGHLWAPSYYLGTLGSVSKEIVQKYIENQLTEYNNGRPRRDSSYD